MTREEAVKVIDGRFEIMDYCENAKLEEALDMAIKALEQPERKTGKWIEQDDGCDGVFYECSVCKDAFTLIDGTPSDNNYNYCPNCGADMRGDSDG